VEDSPHGIDGAQAAGLFTIGVPGPMTGHMEFGAADLLLDSLAHRELVDVAGLLHRQRGSKQA